MRRPWTSGRSAASGSVLGVRNSRLVELTAHEPLAPLDATAMVDTASVAHIAGVFSDWSVRPGNIFGNLFDSGSGVRGLRPSGVGPSRVRSRIGCRRR